MRSAMFRRAVFAVLVLLAVLSAAVEPVCAQQAAAPKRIALVVGNSNYPSAPLKNPANDARDMAAALRRLGFEVIEKTDATQKELLRAIARFGARLSGDSVALFYYAGHGMQVRGKNYLIPIDAQIESEASARVETVDVDGVLDQLNPNALNIVILDACRNNPFERRFRSVGGGLAQMEAPKGTLIAYATSPGKVALDGEGRNGLYTQELLRQMRTADLSIETLFKRVRANVARATGDGQIPWEASSLTGEFYFSGGRAGQPESRPSAAVAVDTPEQIEQDFWNRIRDSHDPVDFEEYLKHYPQGRFVAEARLMGRKLAAATPRTGPPPAAAPANPNRARLGVTIQAVTPALAKAFALPEAKGALVADVAPMAPAFNAGIEPGDVILGFKGEPVTTSEDLPRLVAAQQPGTEVQLQTVRAALAKDRRVVLDRVPKASATPDDPFFGRFFNRTTGFKLADLDAAGQQKLRDLGFELAGDDWIIGVVTKGDFVRTASGKAFAAQAAAWSAGADVALLVRRGDSQSFLTGAAHPPE